MTSRGLWVAVALATATLFGPCFASARQAPGQDPGQATDIDQTFALALQGLIRAGEHQKALDLIDSRADLAPRPDVQRLRAQLLVLTGRESEALNLLEAHLTRQADDALARFQLAELHFSAHRDGAADLAYRLALAGRLDPLRLSMAQSRLAAIQDRRRWRIWAGASLAPDSNINGATSASRVDLFGLPFELDDNARRRGGVSLSAQGGVERRMPWGAGRALRIGLVGSVNDAPGAAFDDAFLSLRVGPEWTLTPALQLSAQISSDGRWYGGELLETSIGGRVEGGLSTAFNTRWSGAGRIDLVDARRLEGRDGAVYGLDLARTRYLGPTSLWRLSFSASYRDADAATERFNQTRLAAGRLYPLPWATLAYVEPYVATRRFEGRALAFGERRQDLEYGTIARLSKRNWSYAGAFPFVAASVARNQSSLVLNRYTRSRVEFGFTREF